MGAAYAAPNDLALGGKAYVLNTITEKDILQFLADIEAGDIRLCPLDDPQSVYAGQVRYLSSNGWSLCIFNDSNEWDYIEYIRTDDGREIDYFEMEKIASVDKYEPSKEVAWTAYGIPGHMTFRCTTCGRKLSDGPPFYAPYLCQEHKNAAQQCDSDGTPLRGAPDL